MRKFFFSSRRRHTRLVSDWSSDVCSSDLRSGGGMERLRHMKRFAVTLAVLGLCIGSASAVGVVGADHNWTIHVGDRYYGASGYDAKTLPGMRTPKIGRASCRERV